VTAAVTDGGRGGRRKGRRTGHQWLTNFSFEPLGDDEGGRRWELNDGVEA
jgi:hypothetical protein